MNTAETPRQRLARLMDERRAELQLTWSEVAERAGITREGLRRTRTGTGHIRSLTKVGIERALSWAPGSIEDILQGGEPRIAASGSATIRMVAPVDEDDERMRRIADLFDQAERASAEGRRLLEELLRQKREGA